MWTVYLLSFSQPVGSSKHMARYYIGMTNNLSNRLAAHRRGNIGADGGSNIIAALIKNGGTFTLVRTWENIPSAAYARELEKRLKRQANHVAFAKGRALGKYGYTDTMRGGDG